MADLIDLVPWRTTSHQGQARATIPQKKTLWWRIYSRMVNRGQPLSAVLEEAFPGARRNRRHPRHLRRIHPPQTRAEHPRLRRPPAVWRASALLGRSGVGEQFEHVLVDEYQDTNPLQASILLSLRAENHN